MFGFRYSTILNRVHVKKFVSGRVEKVEPRFPTLAQKTTHPWDDDGQCFYSENGGYYE